ncbi:hypothetical protein C4580_02205 [Candidatus Woesearchaeota archaeon]|nr:MAG: hypothetical protein C4580_02205 [Candidatus Woesearchaeota archaeon]
MKFLLLFILLSIPALACEDLIDGSVITSSVQLCSDTYDVLSGVTVTGENIVFDCGTAVLRGVLGESEIGVRVENARNVTVRKCNIVTFNQGLYLKNVTHSLIRDNALLKNRIGIRLLDSFENILEKNADKSHQFAVSAINSKFNVVMLDNKNIERGFCEENSCNKFADINPCESGDFYCSPRCSAQNDADCGPVPVPVRLDEPELVRPSPIAAVTIEHNESVPVQEVPPPLVPEIRSDLPWLGELVIYALLYGIAFVGLWVWRR